MSILLQNNSFIEPWGGACPDAQCIVLMLQGLGFSDARPWSVNSYPMALTGTGFIVDRFGFARHYLPDMSMIAGLPIIGVKYINPVGAWVDLHYLKGWVPIRYDRRYADPFEKMRVSMRCRLRAMGFQDAVSFSGSDRLPIGLTGTGWLVASDGLVMREDFEGFAGEFDAF